jgi:hypothetical protein
MGVNGNLPFLPSNNRNRSSLQYTACENTQDNGQCPQQAILPVICHHPKPSYLDKKTFDYLQTKLSGASQQLSTFPLTTAVQHIIQLAQITCTLYTVLCGDMSQLHTIQIV